MLLSVYDPTTMMMPTSESKATPIATVKPPAVPGATDVMRMMDALALMPLHMWAECANQSIPSLVHDLTGLSKARISKGNLDAIRPSTRQKIEAHQQRLLEDQLSDPEILAEVRHRIATAPNTRSGMVAYLAGWAHQLECLPYIPLPMSKAVGLVLDELREALDAACRNDDLVDFKKILLRHIEHHGVAVRIADEPALEFGTTSEQAELQALEDWTQAAEFLKKIVDTLYLDLVSTLDAEWNSHYFADRLRAPVFPLVMVRPQEGLLNGQMPRSRKNLIFRPSRRLLEFLYALAYYIRKKKWPARPPSPRTLARILYRPGAQEVLDTSVVSSYFDGSTKLTFELVCEHWAQLVHHFMPDRTEEQMINPPFPMIMLALQWQALTVLNNGKTLFLIDLERYNFLWHSRRRQWATLQARRDQLAGQVSHPRGDPIEWPAWMLNQLSSS